MSQPHPAAAQVGPPASRAAQRPDCAPGGQAAGSEDEIVVCAPRDPREDERYRIPPALRDNQDRQGAQSWSTQVSEAQDRARFGDQTVGPFGYRQRAAEMTHEWRRERAERQRRRAEEQRLIDAGPQ